MLLRIFLSLLFSATACASTSITFTRAEIDEMAHLWETNSAAISPLANTQYPQFSGDWQFIFSHTSISADGDIHIDLALDAAGTGKTGNNTGASPIIAEVINATGAQLNHVVSLTGAQAIPSGIFRFYTEHVSERHFELHPALQLQRWNGSGFVADSDYHANVTAVPDGNTHAASTLVNLLNGSETVSATIASDNLHVTFTFPSPSVNYVQYDGVATSSIISDAVSDYFLFQPNIVPSATVRCRLVAKTAGADVAKSLTANQTLTVNALTRTDMAVVSTRLARLSAGQSDTFARPVEFIVLGLLNVGPAPSPTPSPTPSPSLLNISTRLRVGTDDNVLIGGFIIQGSEPKRVILRAIGPSLTDAGLSGALTDPMLELHDADGSLIGRNDNWRTTQLGGVITGDQAAEIQASTLAPTRDAEAAIVATLAPKAYTAIVRGAQNQTGIGLAEIYDLDQSVPTRLANISARGLVETGDNVMIAGFIIGNQPTKVIVRGIGPSLTKAGIATPLGDPMLELRDGNGALIAANDNWRLDDEATITKTNLAPSDDLEAAIVRNLAPGNYTAIVRGKDDATGIAVAEVYQLSP
jgi:hypothetical protein